MPSSTSIYGFPYLLPLDPPDIAAATQALAERAEFQVARLDSATVGFEAEAEASPQAISAATVTALRWQTAPSNVGPFGKPNTTDWTVPTSGLYIATVTGLVASGIAGRAYAQVLMGGRAYRTPFGGTGESGWAATGMRRLTAAAVVKAEIYCATGVNMNGAQLAVYRVGP